MKLVCSLLFGVLSASSIDMIELLEDAFMLEPKKALQLIEHQLGPPFTKIIPGPSTINGDDYVPIPREEPEEGFTNAKEKMMREGLNAKAKMMREMLPYFLPKIIRYGSDDDFNLIEQADLDRFLTEPEFEEARHHLASILEPALGNNPLSLLKSVKDLAKVARALNNLAWPNDCLLFVPKDIIVSRLLPAATASSCLALARTCRTLYEISKKYINEYYFTLEQGKRRLSLVKVFQRELATGEEEGMLDVHKDFHYFAALITEGKVEEIPEKLAKAYPQVSFYELKFLEALLQVGLDPELIAIVVSYGPTFFLSGATKATLRSIRSDVLRVALIDILSKHDDLIQPWMVPVVVEDWMLADEYACRLTAPFKNFSQSYAHALPYICNPDELGRIIDTLNPAQITLGRDDLLHLIHCGVDHQRLIKIFPALPDRTVIPYALTIAMLNAKLPAEEIVKFIMLRPFQTEICSHIVQLARENGYDGTDVVVLLEALYNYGNKLGLLDFLERRGWLPYPDK